MGSGPHRPSRCPSNRQRRPSPVLMPRSRASRSGSRSISFRAHPTPTLASVTPAQDCSLTTTSHRGRYCQDTNQAWHHRVRNSPRCSPRPRRHLHPGGDSEPLAGQRDWERKDVFQLLYFADPLCPAFRNGAGAAQGRSDAAMDAKPGAASGLVPTDLAFTQKQRPARRRSPYSAPRWRTRAVVRCRSDHRPAGAHPFALPM